MKRSGKRIEFRRSVLHDRTPKKAWTRSIFWSFFMSVDLMTDLKKKGLGACCTVMPKRKKMPTEIKNLIWLRITNIKLKRILILDGTWLFLYGRLYRPTRLVPRVHYFFMDFLLYHLSGVSRFLLLFTFLWSGILKICLYSLHSRVQFFFFFAFYSTWGGVGRRGRGYS